ncbi:M20 metallopeptidase family protein [Corticicoccus populi]|uniref:M20 family metallopeptidase n=1 Tax=Corticicoccus populi TaxID=1812821 RepID=A0ABW5WS60_9STAP
MSQILTQQLMDSAVTDYRYLHEHPEISWQEFNTAGYIKNRLDQLNIETLNYEMPRVVGYVRGTKGNKTIALRADMDALTIHEDSGKPYASKIDGISHACGHDGHVAVLLTVARWLSENAVEPNVKLIFQPSEEIEPSGAKDLVDKGVLDDVDAVYGIHLWQRLEKGKIGLSHGAMMGSSDDFMITVEGAGGHAALPHRTIDPTYICSHIIQGLQTIVSRETSPAETKVISIGSIQAGSTFNSIPSSAVMKGTVRGFSTDVVDFVEQRIGEIVDGICRTFNATGTLNYIKGTPPLINHYEESNRVEKIVKREFEADTFVQMPLEMIAEDFSHYLLEKPGAFIFVGMGGPSSRFPHHHSKFEVDESVFGEAVKLFIEIVRDY